MLKVCDAEFTYLSRQHNSTNCGYVSDWVRTRRQGFCCHVVLQHLIAALCWAGKSTKSTQLCNSALLTLQMCQQQEDFATFTGNVTLATQICLVSTLCEHLLGLSLSLSLPAAIFLMKYFLWYFQPKDIRIQLHLEPTEMCVISMLFVDTGRKTCQTALELPMVCSA